MNLVEMAQDFANVTFERDGYIMPILICQIGCVAALVPVGYLFVDGVPPERRRAVLSALLGKLSVTSYALVVESWLLESDKRFKPGMTGEQIREMIGQKPEQRVRDHLDRVEIVMISYQDSITGKSYVYEAKIHRQNGETWLGEFKNKGGKLTGLMTDLFNLASGRSAQ